MIQRIGYLTIFYLDYGKRVYHNSISLGNMNSRLQEVLILTILRQSRQRQESTIILIIRTMDICKLNFVSN